EKFAGEFRPNKLRTAAGGSVHDQNRIARLALVVFVDLAERPIMNPQLRQAFTGSEFEIANGVIAFDRRRVIRRQSAARSQNQQKRRNKSDGCGRVNGVSVQLESAGANPSVSCPCHEKVLPLARALPDISRSASEVFWLLGHKRRRCPGRDWAQLVRRCFFRNASSRPSLREPSTRVGG